MTEYNYKVLERVLISIAKDGSNENIENQISILTSDEIRKLRTLMVMVEGTILHREYDELFGDDDGDSVQGS